MIKRGYIKIPRCLFQTEEWLEKRELSRFEAIISLYAQASYKDGRIVHVRSADILLRRGELVSSIRELAEEWRWSASSVDRYLQKLRNSKRDTFRIEKETVIGTLASKITICNYDCCDSENYEIETVADTPFGTADETACETYIAIKGSNTSNGELTEIPTNHLVRDFKIACAQADKREVAFACFQALTNRGWFGTEEGKLLSGEYKFLGWIWLYYPELQRKFEAPLITWQARQIVADYLREDISRVVERMANTKGIEQKFNSFYFTLRSWLKSDFERLDREEQAKNNRQHGV